MDRFDKIRIRANQIYNSISWTLNMKVELQFKCCIPQSQLYSFTKTKIVKNYKTTIAEYIHKSITSMSSIKKQQYTWHSDTCRASSRPPLGVAIVPNQVPRVLKRILSSGMVENDICLGGASKLAFFKKKHAPKNTTMLPMSRINPDKPCLKGILIM